MNKMYPTSKTAIKTISSNKTFRTKMAQADIWNTGSQITWTAVN